MDRQKVNCNYEFASVEFFDTITDIVLRTVINVPTYEIKFGDAIERIYNKCFSSLKIKNHKGCGFGIRVKEYYNEEK